MTRARRIGAALPASHRAPLWALRTAAALALAAAIGLSAAGGASAQTNPRAAEAERRQADAETERSAREAAAAEATERAAQARADRAQLADDLSILGQSIVSREAALEQARKRLAELRREVAAARVGATAARRRMQRLLAQIQRAAREPTPSLLAHPSRPVDAARSAILMRALTDAHAQAQSERRRRLAEIAAATASARTLEATARAEIVALREDEKAVRALLDAKGRLEDVASAAARTAAAEAEALGRRARDLGDLADSLRRQAAERAAQEEAARVAAAAQAAQQAQRLQRREAARREARPSAAPSGPPAGVGPFSQGQGRVLAPAAGDISRSRARGGRRGGGLQILTSPYARVIAPWSGRVRYAGDFRSEGKLVIIEPQNGYALLLSGLDRLDVAVGSTVAAGEPIGRMGGASRGGGEFLFEWSGDAGAAREELYFEILRNGEPVDPAPWLKRQTRRVSGL